MDRLKILKPLLKLEQDEFFCVRILKRRKDNPDLERPVKQLKVYNFFSWEELEEQFSRIKEICNLNNARAYIRLNKQNSTDVSLRCIEEITMNLRNGNSWKNVGVWNSVIGKGGSKDYWVLDIDAEHMEIVEDLILDLEQEFQNRNNELWSDVLSNPTKSGMHLIVKPFDTRILKKYNDVLSSQGLPTIQLCKDANTILYINNG